MKMSFMSIFYIHQLYIKKNLALTLDVPTGLPNSTANHSRVIQPGSDALTADVW